MTVLDELASFTGTDVWYRHPLAPGVTFTEGVHYVAEKAGAYWLLDIIATEGPALREPWQTWKLDVASLTITVDDGNKRTLKTRKLDFTDFPEPGITLWFIDRVIMLPSEY